MSAFETCIRNAVREGNLASKDANFLRETLKERKAALREASARAPLQVLDEAGIDEQAAREAFEQFEREVARRERLTLLTAVKREHLKNVQDKWLDQKNKSNPGEFLIQLLENSGGKLQDGARRGGADPDLLSYTELNRAITGQAHAQLADLIDKFQVDAFGRTQNKPLLREVVRALFGGEASPSVRAFADSWTEVSEGLRKRFNAAGGEIAKLKDWGLPQSHDSVAISRVPKDEWVEFVLTRINPEKMIDYDTGRAFSPDRLRSLVGETYDAIVSDGWSRRDPSGVNQGKSLANRRQEHRFLQFRDADAWLEYQDRFGNGDAFAVMSDHVDRMARDIALLETFGPNPQSTLTFLSQNAIKQAKAAGKKEPRAAVRRAEYMYDQVTGEAHNPVNPTVARTLQTVRSGLVAAQLGSATISALSDTANGMLSRAWIGSRRTHAQIGDVVKYIDVSDGGNRRLAMRSGLVADSMNKLVNGQARHLGTMSQLYAAGGRAGFSENAAIRKVQVAGSKALDVSNRFANQAAETTLSLSGLNLWTRAGRHAHAMEMMGLMADNAGKSFDDLAAGDRPDKAFSRLIERYGLKDDWDTIRASDIYQPEDGATFLRPDEIRASGNQRLAERVLGMINSEVEFAVPTASLRAQTFLRGANRPGEFTTELLNSTAMYKSFAMTILYQLNTRASFAALENGKGAGYVYAGSMLAAMSLFGAGSIQLKELAKGRDPRDMTDPKFIPAAITQGGGLGIFGDFFFADQNRFGGGPFSTIGGPVAGLAGDVARLTLGNVNQAIRGEETKFGREASEFARRYTPGSSIWYLRNVWDRLVIDQMQNMLDPDIDDYRKRKVRRQVKATGNGYWWAPGDPFPERAPNPARLVSNENDE